jgi:hypothetical protein
MWHCDQKKHVEERNVARRRKQRDDDGKVVGVVDVNWGDVLGRHFGELYREAFWNEKIAKSSCLMETRWMSWERSADLLGIGLSYTVFTIILFGVLLFPRQM